MAVSFLLPGGILFIEVACTPIEGEPVNQYPAQEIENPAKLFTRFDPCNIKVTGFPKIGDQTKKADHFCHRHDVQNRHPIKLKLVRKGIYSGCFVEELLIDSHANEEGAQRSHGNHRIFQIDNWAFNGSGSNRLHLPFLKNTGDKAHVMFLSRRWVTQRAAAAHV